MATLGYRVGIVGCGIGGMSAALFLARAGHHVSLFERFDEPRPLGAGLLIQPTGLVTLQKLGMGAEVLAAGCKIESLFGRTVSGKTVFDVRYGDLAPEIHGVGIHRGVLFDLLLQAVRSSEVRLVTGQEVVSAELMADQRVLKSAEGDELGAFDLVVDASGMRSILRPNETIRSARPFPYGAVWAVVERQAAPAFDIGCLQQRYDDAHTMIGVLPIGQGLAPGPEMAAFFWSVPRDGFTAWEAGFDVWRSRVVKLWPETEPLVVQFRSPDDLTQAVYDDVVLRTPIAERFVMIGDAAHGTSPQLGQGANLALQDGQHLAAALGVAEDLQEGLALYHKARRGQVGFYQWMSRMLTPFFQSDSRLAPALRDFGFQQLYHLPYVRGEMLRTLAGFKTGLLTSRRLDEVRAQLRGD